MPRKKAATRGKNKQMDSGESRRPARARTQPGRGAPELPPARVLALPPAGGLQRPVEPAAAGGVSGFVGRLAERLGAPLRPGERRLDSPPGARMVVQRLDPKGSYAGAHLGEISAASRTSRPRLPRASRPKPTKGPGRPKKATPKARKKSPSAVGKSKARPARAKLPAKAQPRGAVGPGRYRISGNVSLRKATSKRPKKGARK